MLIYVLLFFHRFYEFESFVNFLIHFTLFFFSSLETRECCAIKTDGIWNFCDQFHVKCLKQNFSFFSFCTAIDVCQQTTTFTIFFCTTICVTWNNRIKCQFPTRARQFDCKYCKNDFFMLIMQINYRRIYLVG